LYEADETAWLEEMSRLARQRRYDELDYKHLSEYLRDMAKRDRREVFNRLVILLSHLLKWDYQPRRRSRSWKLTILNQQNELEGMLDSQSLRNHAVDCLPKAYGTAVRYAAVETGLAEREFPEECPYTLDEALGKGDHIQEQAE